MTTKRTLAVQVTLPLVLAVCAAIGVSLAAGGDLRTARADIDRTGIITGDHETRLRIVEHAVTDLLPRIEGIVRDLGSITRRLETIDAHQRRTP
jgi:hypothetical protein